MDYTNNIIDFCNNNRVSTTEVADALGKSGVIPNVLPLNSGLHKESEKLDVFTPQIILIGPFMNK